MEGCADVVGIVWWVVGVVWRVVGVICVFLVADFVIFVFFRRVMDDGRVCFGLFF